MKILQGLGWAAAAALAIAPAARAEDQAGTAGSSNSSATQRSSSTDQSTQTSRHDNSDTIRKLHAANVAEIEMANVAKDNAQSDQVKKFADRMVKDHTEMRDALEKVADKRNLKFDKKKELAPYQAHLDQAKKLKGAQFDQHFTHMMVTEHQKDLDDVQNALQQARSTGDHDLAAALENAQTKIQEHYRMAQSLDQGGSQQRMGQSPSEHGSSSGSATAPSSTTGSSSDKSSSTKDNSSMSSGTNR
jgi:putative membrane protein